MKVSRATLSSSRPDDYWERALQPSGHASIASDEFVDAMSRLARQASGHDHESYSLFLIQILVKALEGDVFSLTTLIDTRISTSSSFHDGLDFLILDSSLTSYLLVLPQALLLQTLMFPDVVSFNTLEFLQMSCDSVLVVERWF